MTMRAGLVAVAAVGAWLAGVPAALAACYDGSYTVPAGTSFLNITAIGQAGTAAGGTERHGGGVGGQGAQVAVQFVPVVPGEVLYWGAASPTVPGGTEVHHEYNNASGGVGGNGSFVAFSAPDGSCRLSPSAFLVVAGGGGGGGGGGAHAPGGTGGGAGSGGNPGGDNDQEDGAGGGPGSATAGGGGGAAGHDILGNTHATPGRPGKQAGAGASGGDGGVGDYGDGGNGGGGWWGGGGGGGEDGGGGGGGGGGASYTSFPEVVSVSLTSAAPAVTFTPVPAPTLDLHASPNPALDGKPFTLTAYASSPTDTATITFRDNGFPLGTATMAGGKASLTTTITQRAGQANTHDITASSSDGPDVTASLSLAVDVPPTIDTDGDPASASKTYGTAASFGVAGSGFPRPTIQWQVSHDGGTSYGDLSGQIGNHISYFGAVAESGSLLRAVLTNVAGTATSVPATVTIIRAPASVTASTQSVPYGSAPPAVTGTYAGLQLADTAASLGPITCTTTMVATSPPGPYPSSCTTPANPNYTFTAVPGTVTVVRAPLTVTASSQTATYGTAPAAVTPSYAGFVNGETSAVLTTAPVCTSTATSASAPGVYASSCAGAAAANYAITPVAGTVTVVAAALTITASDTSSTYGDPAPAVTPAYTGFVNGDSPASLAAAPTCTSAVSAATPAGSYPTSCKNAVDDDYAIGYVTGKATVAPAPLTVTAGSGTSVYGSAPPTVAPAYAGFVNTDGPADLTAGPSCSTAATAASPVGAYSSSCARGAAANYVLSYADGVVTVVPAALTITAGSVAFVYGSAPPTIGPVYAGFRNGDDAGALTAPPTCTTTAGASSPVGLYASRCAGAAGPNYAIAYSGGAAIVTPAPLVIAAAARARPYGLANPAFGFTYAGLVDHDTLATGPSCRTTAVPTSAPGSYPITCSGASGRNYAIIYTPSTLVVTRAATTLVASARVARARGTYRALLTREADGAPITGMTVRFSVGRRTVCTARTTSSGVASCRGRGVERGGAGYTAAYAGNEDYLGATATGSFR